MTDRARSVASWGVARWTARTVTRPGSPVWNGTVNVPAPPVGDGTTGTRMTLSFDLPR